MRAGIETDLSRYPYDTQNAEIVISSTDYSAKKVKLNALVDSLLLKQVKVNTKRWNKLTGVNQTDVWLHNERAMETLIHEQYLDSAEWKLLGKFRTLELNQF